MESLLTVLKVLDLTRGMAGAVATMLLADNGANVIKLEPPEGDFLRHELPHHVWNRNKRSAVCDLKTDAGRALFKRALPLWSAAEHEGREAMGTKLTSDLHGALDRSMDKLAGL